MTTIVIGEGDHEYDVNVMECTLHDHKCVHDWRIHWGNVPKTGFRPEEQ